MGTETKNTMSFVRIQSLNRVKLNNPLMGTETYCIHNHRMKHHAAVKLNNLLMGTETHRR